jgi:succinate dehydrogenase / fumarate reductase, cytochrome b subunit
MSLSILHRFTGVALALGLVALCYWLVALASGEDSFRTVEQELTSPLGIAFLVGWTFAFFYHLLNGVRHLFWDLGLGFERRQWHASGWFAVLGAVVLTIVVWALIWRWHT